MTPDAYTNQELMLDVGDGHALYVHDWGSKTAAKPILFLHGGPGGGCNDGKKNQFDPETQRVIFFDQRGSGKSEPAGSLENNTTQHIIADMIKILDQFATEQCILTGGSWGSALAFYFAIAHPERVSEILVDGVYTGSKAENDWVNEGGLRTFFPDAWAHYISNVPTEYRADPTSYHFTRILSEDTEAIKSSAYAFGSLQGAAVSLDDRFTAAAFETYDPGSMRIEAHYLHNGCFVPERYVFENVNKLTMPVYMVQGRYDMVCPPRAAYELSTLLPNSQLIWTTSGHRAERETWNVKRTILQQLTGET